MRRMSLLVCSLLISLLAATQNTTRTLYWSGGNKSWPNVTGSRTWDDKRNWVDGNNIQPATNVSSGDKLVVNGTGVKINVSSNMTISFTDLVIEVQGGASFTINSGIVLTFSNASTAFSMIATTSGNGLIMEKLAPPSQVTKLVLGGVVKAMNDGATNLNLYGSYSALGLEPLAATSAGFGGFDVGSLPVSLVDFNATTTGGRVNLTWTTGQEAGVRDFVVERSANANTWQEIGVVSAAGQASTSTAYRFSDANPSGSLNYYRIRIRDNDGKWTLTPVRAIRINEAGIKPGIFPNPARNLATIVVNQQNRISFEVLVFNRNGQLVNRQQASGSTNVLMLDVSRFPAGDYLVDIRMSDGTHQSAKLVVVKQ